MNLKNEIFALIGALVISLLSLCFAKLFNLNPMDIVAFAALTAVLKNEMDLDDLRKKLKL